MMKAKVYFLLVIIMAYGCKKNSVNNPDNTTGSTQASKPIADFNFKFINGGVLPTTVSFSDSSKYAESYKWDFGEGTIATSENPSNNYYTAKTYTVKLVVANSFGKDSISKQIIITLSKPKANFNFTIVDNGNLPTTVNFLNLSTGTNSYQWYFDDGNQSTLASPTHGYTASKSYNVKLVAINAAGKDSIIKQVVVTINKPTSDFTYVVNNTGSIPANISFTNTALRAVSYLWDFNDGTASTLPNPQHTYAAGNSYTVKLTTTNSSGSSASTQTVNVSPYPQAYTSFDGKSYTLYSWEGAYVTILMRNRNLDPTIMFNWAHTMDKVYLYYKSVTGQEPSKYFNVTYINNHTTIADVATSCGAGCGYLGTTGIEMLNSYTDRMYTYLQQYNEYDQELFYEFGRNFWLYGNQLAYKTNDPVATGFAIFMRFMAMDATMVNPAPFNSTPWSTFRADFENLVNVYQANASYTWSNTLGLGQGISNDLGASDLLASFLVRIKRDYGGDTFVNNFWKQAGLRPAANTTQDAVDNFILAACAATNKNLTTLFTVNWRWPMSDSAKIEAAKYP